MNWRPAGLVGAEVEDLHDVRVDEPGGGERLAPEARDEVRVLGQVLGEQLDRHVPLQPRVERELDRGHAADPEAVLEPVAVGEEGVGGHRSLPGRNTVAAAGSSVGAGSPPEPGSVGAAVGVGVGRGRRGRRRGRRRRSGSRSASGVSVGVSVGAGVGVSSGSALHCSSIWPSRWSSQSRRFCLAPRRSCAGARRAAARASLTCAPRGGAVAGVGGRAGVRDQAREPVGVVLRDQRVGSAPRSRRASALSRTARRSAAVAHGPKQASELRRSLPVLQPLGERVGQPGGADRGLARRRGRSRRAATPPSRRSCRAPSTPPAGRRRAAGRSSRG